MTMWPLTPALAHRRATSSTLSAGTQYTAASTGPGTSAMGGRRLEAEDLRGSRVDRADGAGKAAVDQILGDWPADGPLAARGTDDRRWTQD